MTGLTLGWLLLGAGSRKSGSLLVLVSGMLQLTILVVFFVLSSRVHRKLFVGELTIQVEEQYTDKLGVYPPPPCIEY